MEFKTGDVVRHKATLKRCVVKEIRSDGHVGVTTQDDVYNVYISEELEPYKEPKHIRFKIQR